MSFWDDLGLLEHRWLSQLPKLAAGAHFEEHKMEILKGEADFITGKPASKPAELRGVFKN